MSLLQAREVAAVIMLDAVAYHLAQEGGLNIRPLQRTLVPASPVAIAVTRNDAQIQQV